MKIFRLSAMDSAGDEDDQQPSQVVAVMPRRRYWAAPSLLLAIALVIGCARQYHWYDCGCDCVNYRYCPPAPLPYSPYCSCPTPVSSSYNRLLQAATQDAETIPDNAPAMPGTVDSTRQPTEQ